MPTDNTNFTREHAQRHISRGWAVFLLATDGPEGKIPVRNCERCDPRTGDYHDKESCGCLTCHGFYAATTSLERFDQMLERFPNGYLAVRTGKASRILVLDAEASSEPGEPTGLEVVDQWEVWTDGRAGALPYTLTARTVSGGVHMYFRIPPGTPHLPSRCRILPSVDVKADGGLVGAVGSKNRVWLDENAPLATLPSEFISWYLAQRGHGKPGSTSNNAGRDRPDGYDFDTFLRDGCPDGHRDYFLNDLLFRLRKANHSKERITELAYEAWEKIAQPPEARKTCEWMHVCYKIDRVWNEVQPDETVSFSWPGVLQPRAEGVTQVEREIAGQRPNLDAEFTETGNAHRFVRLFEGRALYVPGAGWYLWDDTRWCYDKLNDVFDATQHVLEDLRREAESADPDHTDQILRWRATSSTMRQRHAMLTGASADPRMKIDMDSLDSNPYLLVVPNGTVDLRTGQHRESDPDDRCTQVAGVPYDPEARAPRWEDHVRLVTGFAVDQPDPVMYDYVQRWAGYTLTGLVTEQKFFFGYGGGKNGKNVLIDTLLGVMGTYGIRGSAKVLSEVREHDTIIADLAGARMVFIDETPRGKINESRVKALVGNEKIRARRVMKDSFEFVARFKLWLAGNNKPKVSETSDGFWRRLDLMPFDVQIPAERRVKGYSEILLKDEGSGILNWCLVGLRNYLERGLEPPSRVFEAGQEYRDEENLTWQFIEDNFAVESGERVWHPNKVIRYFYEEWCREQGIKNPLNNVGLGHELSAHKQWFTKDPTTRKIRWMWPNVKSGVERGWSGPPLVHDVPTSLKWEGNSRPKS